MDEKIKYLEMIQQNIIRMSSNSFIVKGWSVTSIGAMYAFWLTNMNKTYSIYILLLILFITLIFWGHDAYYLKLERDYRNRYEFVRKSSDCEEELFNLTPLESGETVLCVAISRPILRNSYGLIVLLTLILFWIMKK